MTDQLVPRVSASGGDLPPDLPEAIVAVDPDGRITQANSGAEFLFGYSWDELAQRPLDDLLREPAELQDATAQPHAGIELACLRKDGSEFLAELSLTPMDTPEGPLVSVAIRDLGRRNRAVERMRWLSAIVEHAHTPIVSASTDGTITSWNTAAERVYGWTSAEMVGRPITAFVEPVHAELVSETLAQVREGETVHIPDGQILRADGRRVAVSVTASPIVGPNGGVVGIAYAARDLSDSERAEAKFRWLLNATPLAIIGVDVDGRIQMANTEATRAFGYLADELVGEQIDTVLPDARQAVLDESRSSRRGVGQTDVDSSRATGRRKDGSEFPADIRLSSLLTEDGVLIAVTVHDMTARLEGEAERLRLENELQRSQRLDSLGQLAGGVAHDFNNVLAIILSHASIAEEDLNGLESLISLGDDQGRLAGARRAVEQMHQAAERGSRLTKQLLAFGRREVVRPQVFLLSEVMADVTRLLAGTLGTDVRVSTSSDPELWPVTADPGRIEQVLVNLAVNARDAMPKGGTLQIDAANVALDSAQAARYGLTDGRYVQLRVTDTGTGMPPEVAERAFEPFYTTKPEGQGTGLGLASVYGIVSQAAGTVYLRSRPGWGTTVTILLPASDGAPTTRPEAPGAGRPPTPEARPDRCVLVVDDEPDLRKSIEIILGRGGYAVLSAGSGDEATQLASAYEGTIDLLLTDVTMPGLSGQEVANRLRIDRPSMRVLYMSGFAQPLLTSKGTIGPDVTLVEKPFTRRSLLAKVAEVLTPA
ncbi:PAS domain-containing hybrid sensor histidine kinase/response regulator [Cryptosporangium aurantiacum]|uniref:histidine kinase n=1 Tax=Cryptosporangium aurantiacum TaxID=134849 RepID=A0A1M7QEY1_9ACTN|nr:PAS domain-containing sensor histidine kinase [Cryptosporangium aurantiacum]SHN29487.1 PAS/PAC sensor hybrid histidine kinase [Cryptosporangium aurantiacum]